MWNGLSPAWSLYFHLVCVYVWSLSDSPVPPRGFVLHSPLELSIVPLIGVTSPISFLCRQQDLVSSTVRGRRLTFGKSLFTPFNGRRAVEEPPGNYPEVWSILDHLSWLDISPANLLYREDLPSLHTWGRHDLSSIQGNQFENRRLEGVRIWKLNRTYPDEKPPSLSVHTQAYIALAGNTNHPSGDKSPLQWSNSPLSSTCSGNTASSFPRILK